MERGTISSVRDNQGNDILADVELLRSPSPPRLHAVQTKFALDRLSWLYKNATSSAD